MSWQHLPKFRQVLTAEDLRKLDADTVYAASTGELQPQQFATDGMRFSGQL
jgi:hypothetical protein